MVVDDFDMGRTLLGPDKADAPLIVNPDGMLPLTMSGKSFEPVAGSGVQVLEISGGVQHIELAQCLFFDPAESFHEPARPEALGGSIAKRRII